MIFETTCDFKPRATCLFRVFSYLEENPLGAEVLDDEVRRRLVDMRRENLGLAPFTDTERRDLGEEQSDQFLCKFH